MRTFTERLAIAIDDSGMSNSQIIKALNLKSRSGIKKWLDGAGKPDAENAVRLAVVLGVRPEWLVLGTGEKHSPVVQLAESPADSYLSSPIGQYIDKIDNKIHESRAKKSVDISELLNALIEPPTGDQWRKIVEHYMRAGFDVVTRIKW